VSEAVRGPTCRAHLAFGNHRRARAREADEVGFFDHGQAVAPANHLEGVAPVLVHDVDSDRVFVLLEVDDDLPGVLLAELAEDQERLIHAHRRVKRHDLLRVDVPFGPEAGLASTLERAACTRNSDKNSDRDTDAFFMNTPELFYLTC